MTRIRLLETKVVTLYHGVYRIVEKVCVSYDKLFKCNIYCVSFIHIV